MVEAHSVDVINALLWVVGLFGSALCAIAIWGFNALLGKLQEQDKALREIQETVQNELKELRDMHHALDTRITRIEAVVQAKTTP